MAKKKSAKSKSQRTPSKRKAGAGARATARSAGGRRKTAGAKPPAGKARRKSAKHPPRPGKTRAKSGSRKAAARASRKRTASTSAHRKTGQSRSKPARARKTARRGGTGREPQLAQTPETGRTVQGRTNPMKTVRSTGKPAGAGDSREAPALNRARKQLREIEETIEGPPSSLNMDRTPSAASSGRRRMQQTLDETNETGPVMTGGDVDADWGDAYAVGDEAPGGDNPTPDQDIVDDIGKALGVEYQDNEELKGADKLKERDKHRWELDPASSDDYLDRE